jgi:hypothetical protein
MDEKAKAVRERLRKKLMKQEKKGKKRVDGIFTADEHQVFIGDGKPSLDELHALQLANDPGFVPTGCCTYTNRGRAIIIPWEEAKRREKNGTLRRVGPFSKAGAKSVVKQMNSGRIKVQFYCENCFKISQGVEPLKGCSVCRAVAYCSPDCQKEHWKKQHKYDCSSMKAEGRTY